MLTEQRGVQFPRSLQTPSGHSMMCSMRWPSADRCFTRLWHLVPNLCSQRNRISPSGNLSCPSLTRRSPRPLLQNNLPKWMRRRSLSGTNPGLRNCQVVLVSASGTTWDLVGPVRPADMLISAPYPKPTVSHALAIIWHRSTWQRHTDLMVVQMQFSNHLH